MKSVAVIGLGLFGQALCRHLYKKAKEVIAIDLDEKRVNGVNDYCDHGLIMDASDLKAMQAAGLDELNTAVIAIGDDLQSSILSTLNVIELKVPQIICKALDDRHEKILKAIGADTIIFPERDMGERVAASILSTNTIEHIILSEDAAIEEIYAPQKFLNRSLAELKIRREYGLNIIGIKRHETMPDGRRKEKLNFTPAADDVIRSGDRLMVVGTKQDLDNLRKKVK